MIKYISFSPHSAGLVNVIMSYELFLAIAEITKRKVILPPYCRIDHLKNSCAELEWIDIWQIFNKDILLEEFDCIEHNDVPEFEEHLDVMRGEVSYTKNIDKCGLDLYQYIEPAKLISSSHVVFVNDIEKTKDFREFAYKRDIFDLNTVNQQFLHFEGNLFGHFWYNVYPGGEDERNKLKNKINRVLRYRDEFYSHADVVSQKIGPYNAIHVRRGDFLWVMKTQIEDVIDSEKLLDAIEYLPFENPDLPLYIATDEKDMSFFDEIKEKFDIYFYTDIYNFSDEGSPKNKLKRAVLEQTICAQADNFFGTYYSTFSKRINIMRGLDGRQAADHLGVNDLDTNENLTHVFPWLEMPNKHWGWCHSSHPQWLNEKNGKWIDNSRPSKMSL